MVAHWLLELSPRTLIGWGWVEAPTGPRPPRGPGGDQLVHLAREFGEWAAWAMIALGIIALLRFIPYGRFRKVHKIFPVVFLMGAFHSVMLTPGNIVMTPLGILVLIMAIGGSVIAVMSLMQMIGKNRRTAGEVIGIVTQANGVVDLLVQPDDSWTGHRAGQFALLTLDPKEGPHPFTIASDWTPGASLRFTIKPLGDYTRTLAAKVAPGQAAVLEGPYGGFDFNDRSERQVWVAGGIGLAPFLARLDALAAEGGAKSEIHMFYSVLNDLEARFPEGLAELCQRAKVQLHMRVVNRDGMIQSEEIGRLIRDRSSVWFCGPAAWGKGLRKVLVQRYGLSSTNFHQEVFQFR